MKNPLSHVLIWMMFSIRSYKRNCIVVFHLGLFVRGVFNVNETTVTSQ